MGSIDNAISPIFINDKCLLFQLGQDIFLIYDVHFYYGLTPIDTVNIPKML